jgi:hypothetical protein
MSDSLTSSGHCLADISIEWLQNALLWGVGVFAPILLMLLILVFVGTR